MTPPTTAPPATATPPTTDPATAPTAAPVTVLTSWRDMPAQPPSMSAISVETLNGTVMLSGFAKNNAERSEAERLACRVAGVKAVKNEIAVRP